VIFATKFEKKKKTYEIERQQNWEWTKHVPFWTDFWWKYDKSIK